MFKLRLEDLPVTDVDVRAVLGGLHARVFFENGYEASVIQHDCSYGLEVAVCHDGAVVYDTKFGGDVRRHLDTDTLRDALVCIASLSERSPFAKPGLPH